MKLDPTYLQYISKDELRVLLAVEMGMKNHENVPVHLIERISHLKRASAYTVLRLLLKNKLVSHTQKKCLIIQLFSLQKLNLLKDDGYKLTYLGYDYLALHTFIKRGSIKTILQKIGVGKESDIYKCKNEKGEYVILKLARLGRVSFRTIKKNRDYIKYRTNYNWLYLSRLASIKEYSFMEILNKNGFCTPNPIDWNRHGIVMSLIDGYTFCNVKEMENPGEIFDQCLEIIKRLAEHGLIHSDFNEFNLMINQDRKITMIDFPQMVSTQHENAQFYFERDVECIHIFFQRRYGYFSQTTLDFTKIQNIKRLDVEVKASGFIKKQLDKNIDDLDLLQDYENINKEQEENLDNELDQQNLENENDQDNNNNADEDNNNYNEDNDEDQNVDNEIDEKMNSDEEIKEEDQIGQEKISDQLEEDRQEDQEEDEDLRNMIDNNLDQELDKTKQIQQPEGENYKNYKNVRTNKDKNEEETEEYQENEKQFVKQKAFEHVHKQTNKKFRQKFKIIKGNKVSKHVSQNDYIF